jgi:hypothetical protein
LSDSEIKAIQIELLFEKWWLPALAIPIEYGISLCTIFEFAYISNVVYITKILKAILYNKALEGNTEFDITVNEYIVTKR